jgi:O-antigen/teichoic acid export membrane protein
MFGTQSAVLLRFYYIMGNRKSFILFNNLNNFIVLLLFIILTFLNIFIDSYNFLMIFLTGLFYGLYLNQINISRIRSNFNEILLYVLYQSIIHIGFLYIFRANLTFINSLIFLVLSFIFSILLVQKEFNWKLFYLKINFKIILRYKNNIKYAIPIVLIGLFNFMLSSMDQYFLMFYGYKNDLPGYIANYNIAEKSVTAVISIISLVFVPTIFKKYKKLEIDTFKDVAKVSGYFLIISILIVCLLYVKSMDLSALLTSEKFIHQSWIIPYIAFGAIFLGLNSIASEILTVQYKTLTLLYCYFFGFFINFIINLFFVKNYGIYGAVMGTIISYVVMYITTLLYVYREYRLIKLRIENV